MSLLPAFAAIGRRGAIAIVSMLALGLGIAWCFSSQTSSIPSADTAESIDALLVQLDTGESPSKPAIAPTIPATSESSPAPTPPGTILLVGGTEEGWQENATEQPVVTAGAETTPSKIEQAVWFVGTIEATPVENSTVSNSTVKSNGSPKALIEIVPAPTSPSRVTANMAPANGPR